MSELPSQEDLERLSQRAIVAYAARCARRVQPLYRSNEPKHVEALDLAIAAAEAFASGAGPPDFADEEINDNVRIVLAHAAAARDAARDTCHDASASGEAAAEAAAYAA